MRRAAAVLTAILCVGAAVPAIAAEGPPVTADTRQVMFVANNHDGTADLVDPQSFAVLDRLDVIPDIEERMAEIVTDPERLAFFLAIQQGIGQGNDQLADDMFSSHDGRTVYVSRPSLADVVGIDLASGEIVWRFPMEGQRSDHMGISPDGTRLLVSDSTAAKVHVLDPSNGAKVDEFASGDTPHESNYSKDGSTIFHASIGLVYTPTDLPALDTTKGDRFLQVVDAETYDVERYDLAENLAAREGAVQGRPYPDNSSIRPMAVAPDEQELFLQLSFFHGYVRYDLTSHTITEVVNLPDLFPEVPREQYLLDSAHHGLTINPDGDKLCAAGTNSNYAAIVPVDDPDSHVRVDGIDKPYWSTNGPGGRHCWVSASGADEVVVIDYATGTEVTRIPVGDHPQRMRLGVVQRSLFEGAPTAGPAPAVGSPAAAPAAPPAAGRSLPTTGLGTALPALALVLGAAALVRRRQQTHSG